MGSVATMSIFWAALKAATDCAPSRLRANCTRMGANGDDGCLEPHGKGHADMRPEVAAAHVPVRPGQPENGKPFKNVGGAAEARNQLGGYGGDGSPRGSHAEPQDQRQVQRNVQYAGQNQEIEGRPAVPEGAENVGEEVEQHGCADAPGNDDDVGVGRLQDFRRSLQQFQNGTSEGDADGGQQDGHDGTQDDADGKAAPHRPPAARSKALGRDDSQPRRESDDEAEDEKHQAACAAHGGQGFHASVRPTIRVSAML